MEQPDYLIPQMMPGKRIFQVVPDFVYQDYVGSFQPVRYFALLSKNNMWYDLKV